MNRALVLAVALLPLAAQASGRSLKQDALSNSNGCLATIPKCEPGACATRNIMGTAQWACLRCLANYLPVVDASGQDNIIQCVCSKGFYEPASNATSCSRCPTNAYCPGGDQVQNPTNRGNPVQCGAGLITRNTGARSQVDCVAPAGYAMTSPTTATACGRSSYAPMYNRLGKCLRCQSGLEEALASGLNDGDRTNKRAVCKVPPGKYVSQGLVRICPQSFYRANFVDFDAAVAQKCVACNPGITTAGAGAKVPAECNVVLPGYGVDNVYNVTNPSNIPTLPQNSSGLPAASVCDIGFYSAGGYCAQCPAGTVTRVKGAKSIEECVVPPGYCLPSGSMTECPDYFFRESWLMFSDPKATTCTACGDNIRSEPCDLDENPRAVNGSLVRATSTSCYIEAGQGMIATGKNLFAGKDCPANTYGAAGKVYGLVAAPCKPCPRNMITDGLSKVNDSDICINPDGFGYASEGASRCAPGFYSRKGSRKPCQQCPVGRTTLDDVMAQRLFTDCIVSPGYGVVNSSANSTDAYNPNTDGAGNNTLSQLPVLECPLGYYGSGGTPGAKCIACPAGATTISTGSANVTQCSVCVAGYGKPNSASTTCSLCPYGTFQPGGFDTCRACPQSSFYPPVDGQGDVHVSDGTTLNIGAFNEESCVPKQSQLSPEAGQAYFIASTTVPLTTAPKANLTDCLASCPADSCCLAQFDGANCTTATLAPAASSASGPQLAYKLPPSTLGSASSLHKVKGKMMASGYYAHCTLNSADLGTWFTVGFNLTASGGAFARGPAVWDTSVSSKEDCKKKCDDSNVCFGFISTTVGGAVRCAYRGGVDALGSRAFFALPLPSSTLDINSFGW